MRWDAPRPRGSAVAGLGDVDAHRRAGSRQCGGAPFGARMRGPLRRRRSRTPTATGSCCRARRGPGDGPPGATACRQQRGGIESRVLPKTQRVSHDHATRGGEAPIGLRLDDRAEHRVELLRRDRLEADAQPGARGTAASARCPPGPRARAPPARSSAPLRRRGRRLRESAPSRVSERAKRATTARCGVVERSNRSAPAEWYARSRRARPPDASSCG
jgi:hypothetical protein